MLWVWPEEKDGTHVVRVQMEYFQKKKKVDPRLMVFHPNRVDGRGK